MRDIPLLCPECKDRVANQKALSAHIERHREIKPPVADPKTGEMMSKACSMGCGRHFLKPSEYREHNQNCDGSPPLWKPPVAPEIVDLKNDLAMARRRKRKRRVKMPSCNKCDYSCPTARGLSKHMTMKHKGGAPAKRVRSPEVSKDSSTSASLAFQLREQARLHREKADKLEEMAEGVDSLL